MIGSPSRTGRSRGNLKLEYETTTVKNAIVPPTSSMPVTEKSFCVTPC
jgi:hypothetical protein